MPGAAPTRQTKVPEIRKGDVVQVVTGKDAGKQGEVDRLVGRDRVVVRGLNIAKRHTKPRQRQSRTGTDQTPRIQQGGILEVPQPVAVADVMIVCPSCGEPTRVKHTRPEGGKSIRICAHCSQPLNREVRS